MAGKFNFNAVMKLDTKQFQKGVKDVQKSINGLYSSFKSFAGSLGVGLGLYTLISQLKETSQKLSVAQQTLMNVSKSTAEYADNIEWLRKISNDYGQDLLELTNSFAQFKAAASTSNLTLEQTKNIYEALTKASGAFHLSSERTRDVMIAVTQMLSKGKVTAEELRRQLGNSIPGAFNIMAKAAQQAGITVNGTTAELEEMMKKGKVISEEVLPAFAAQLNMITANADFDSLQSSMNRFKNAWTNLVDKGQFQQDFKALTDMATKFMNVIANNVNMFKNLILSGGIVIAVKKAYDKALAIGSDFYTKMGAQYDAYIAKVKSKSYLMAENNQRYIDFGRNYGINVRSNETQKVNLDGRVGTRTYYTIEPAEDVEKLISKHQQLNSALQERQGILNALQKDTNRYNEVLVEQSRIKGGIKEIENNVKSLYEYNDAILKVDEASRNLGKQPLLSKDARKELEATQKALSEVGNTIGTTLVNQTSKWSKAWRGVSLMIKTVTANLKAMASALISTLVISTIITAIQKIVDYFRKAKEEAAAAAEKTVELKNSIEQAGVTVDKNAARAKALLKVIEQLKKSGETNILKKAINEINTLMGKTEETGIKATDTIDTMEKKLNDFIESAKEAARQMALLGAIQKFEQQKMDATLQYEMLKSDPNYNKVKTYKNGKTKYRANVNAEGGVEAVLTDEALALRKKINEQVGLINDANKALAYLYSNTGLTSAYANDTSNGGGGGGGTIKGGTLNEVRNNYQKALKELDNQLKNGAVNAEDYQDALRKLNIETFEKASKFDNFGKSKNKSLNQWSEYIKGAGIEGKTYELFKEFAENFTDELDKGLKDGFEKYLKELAISDEVSVLNMPERKGRNKITDYSLSDSEIMEADMEVDKDYLDALEKVLEKLIEIKNKYGELNAEGNKLFNELSNEIDNIGEHVINTQNLITFAKWKEEIQSLQKEFNSGLYGSIKNVAEGIERLTNSVKNLNEEWADNSGWENFLAILNVLTSTIESVSGVVKGVSELTAIYEKLNKAKEAGVAISALAKGAELMEAKASESVAGAKAGEIVATEASANAKAGEAVAGAAASVAWVPIAGAALAAAAIAGIVALIASNRSKFANGGIVGGNSYSGDKVLAGLNSGEMVLNGKQQGKLWNMINNGSGGGTNKQQVELKVRGSDLIGVLKNYNSKMNG